MDPLQARDIATNIVLPRMKELVTNCMLRLLDELVSDTCDPNDVQINLNVTVTVTRPDNSARAPLAGDSGRAIHSFASTAPAAERLN
jgi:hypothetical protein